MYCKKKNKHKKEWRKATKPFFIFLRFCWMAGPTSNLDYALQA
jgi:hypothetical protein